jgi:hypothetical protein
MGGNDMVEEQWAAPIGQINALSAFVGILVGALRAKGVLHNGEIEQVFQLADSVLPEQSGNAGAQVLATLRLIVNKVE